MFQEVCPYERHSEIQDDHNIIVQKGKHGCGTNEMSTKSQKKTLKNVMPVSERKVLHKYSQLVGKLIMAIELKSKEKYVVRIVL